MATIISEVYNAFLAEGYARSRGEKGGRGIVV